MALDGIFLRHVKDELQSNIINARVDKIYQPGKEEVVFSLRTRNDQLKLLLCVRADSSRVNITKQTIENPKVPPMLCMLLRKKLVGARLTDIKQDGLERVISLEFEAVNSLGDKEKLSLVAELMGKYSNVILLNKDGIIIDALKRVDDQMSSLRLVLPGIKYQAPPKQDKLCLLDCDPSALIDKLVHEKQEVSKSLLRTVQGVSPVVCREVEFLSNNPTSLEENLNKLINSAKQINGKPYMVIDESGKPIEFSFMPIFQYDNLGKCYERESFSELLDEFFLVRDSVNRMRVRSQDLHRNLSNIKERLVKKINVQKQELLNSMDREDYKQFGDIINANLYRLKKGMNVADLENFYDDMKIIKIKLDPMLTPSQNSQLYYKKYRKASNAEKALKLQIDKAEVELNYIESVIEALTCAESNDDLDEIRTELFEQGYIKSSSAKKAKSEKLNFNPIEFTSSEGFKILVGRNNKQNDILTLKKSAKLDIWFHTKNIPGSHTVLVTDGKTPGEASILEAAAIAASHSKAKNSSNVAVDYTEIKNVKKPQGLKPGMVVYVKYKTLYVTPKL